MIPIEITEFNGRTICFTDMDFQVHNVPASDIHSVYVHKGHLLVRIKGRYLVVLRGYLRLFRSVLPHNRIHLEKP